MSDSFFYPVSRIGIIGGGQLARMLTLKAKQMGFYVAVLDPTPNSPAGQIADHELVGHFYDADKLHELAASCDVTTYDIEHIDTDALKQLHRAGRRLIPSPHLLDIIQDKLTQKSVLKRHGLPVPRFESMVAPDPHAFETFGYPLVQKARRGGYDGRGVAVLRSAVDFGLALQVDSLIEECVDLDKELAVMVARSQDGEVQSYPVTEMLFNQDGNILDYLLAPAQISEKLSEAAQSLAIQSVEALQGVGVFGVELFLSKSGELFVNEIAPRPHNSGHYTIEACVTSQFEQHLRAITGLPLGSTGLLRPAVMINLLGEPGFSGPPLIDGLPSALAIPGVSFHLYGKAETRPLRKMGHVTIVDDSLDAALSKAHRIKDIVKIKGRQT
ncbi:MAG TPA: 5-(carboxyamino)imidazole ribonucleotide synthase [bacterium]